MREIFGLAFSMWYFRRHRLFSVWLIALALAVFSPVQSRSEDRRAPVAVPALRAWEAEAIDAIASLADPAKLATLGVRGSNQRVQKIIYWLLAVKKAGGSPEAVIDAALARFGWKGTPQGDETKLTIMRNLQRALLAGLDNPEGMAEMRRGGAPTIRKGPFLGDEMGIDHVLPRAAVPELDNVLANLELMPTQMNRNKSDKLQPRTQLMARRFVASGLLDPASVPWAAPFASPPPGSKPAPSPAAPAPPVAPPAATAALAGSTRSPVFHTASCSALAAIMEANLVSYASREETIQAGKRPCPKCQP